MWLLTTWVNRVSSWVSHLQAMSQHNEEQREPTITTWSNNTCSLSPADSGGHTGGSLYLPVTQIWLYGLKLSAELLLLVVEADQGDAVPWVMLVTHLGPPVSWLLPRLRGLTNLVLTGLELALLTDLVTPGPILTTLTLASLSRAACLSDARSLVDGLLSSWWCCLLLCWCWLYALAALHCLCSPAYLPWLSPAPRPAASESRGAERAVTEGWHLTLTPGPSTWGAWWWGSHGIQRLKQEFR